MKQVTLFFAALFRHWLLVLSGPLLSAALSVVERSTAVAIAFRYYVMISACGVLVALYRAWLDEHRARVQAEERSDFNRPAVAMILRDESEDGAPWITLRNMGATPAFNVHVVPVALGGDIMKADDVTTIQADGEAPPGLRVDGWSPTSRSDLSRVMERVYEAVLKSQFGDMRLNNAQTPNLDDESWHVLAIVRVGELIVPLQIEYRDLGGTEYLTQQHFVLHLSNKRLTIRLVAASRRGSATPLAAPFIVPGTG